jgi:hypothetical protein
MEAGTLYTSAGSLDRLNNNNKTSGPELPAASPGRGPSSPAGSQANFARSRELMAALCSANPQFTASVLEDYVRPVFR